MLELRPSDEAFDYIIDKNYCYQAGIRSASPA